MSARHPILVSRRRYWMLWFARDTDSQRYGDSISGRIPRGTTRRQRVLRERREQLCPHAHISGGGYDHINGDYFNHDCDDCGAVCPERSSRIIRESSPTSGTTEADVALTTEENHG